MAGQESSDYLLTKLAVNVADTLMDVLHAVSEDNMEVVKEESYKLRSYLSIINDLNKGE